MACTQNLSSHGPARTRPRFQVGSAALSSHPRDSTLRLTRAVVDADRGSILLPDKKPRVGGGIDFVAGDLRFLKGAGGEKARGVGIALDANLAKRAGRAAQDGVVAVMEDAVDRIEAGGENAGGDRAADLQALDRARGEGVVGAAEGVVVAEVGPSKDEGVGDVVGDLDRAEPSAGDDGAVDVAADAALRFYGDGADFTAGAQVASEVATLDGDLSDRAGDVEVSRDAAVLGGQLAQRGSNDAAVADDSRRSGI